MLTFCFSVREKICSANGCFQRHTETTKDAFYAFPKNPHRLQQWILVCGLQKADKNNVICALHFSDDLFKDRALGSKPQLRLDAVPNRLLNPHQSDENTINPPKRRRVLMDIVPPGQIPSEPVPLAVDCSTLVSMPVHLSLWN